MEGYLEVINSIEMIGNLKKGLHEKYSILDVFTSGDRVYAQVFEVKHFVELTQDLKGIKEKTNKEGLVIELQSELYGIHFIIVVGEDDRKELLKHKDIIDHNIYKALK